MAKCEVCDKEGTTFTYDFGKDPNMAPMCMCRSCYGKLILSLPKNPNLNQMKLAINKLFERAEEDKSKYGKRRY